MINFTNWLKINWVKDNIFSPPLNPQLGITYLKDYLLGKDWYSNNPIHQEQINTEIVHEILYKYSKKYRREYKQACKIADKKRRSK